MSVWQRDSKGGKIANYSPELREVADFLGSKGYVDDSTISDFYYYFRKNDTYTKKMHLKKRVKIFAIFFAALAVCLAIGLIIGSSVNKKIENVERTIESITDTSTASDIVSAFHVYYSLSDGRKDDVQNYDKLKARIRALKLTEKDIVKMYEGLNFSRKDDGYAIKAKSKFDSDTLIIPSSYKGKPVIKIKERAFEGFGMIETVMIPDSIQLIESYAFSGCDSLKYVTLGQLEIKPFAINNCKKLEKVYFKGDFSDWSDAKMRAHTTYNYNEALTEAERYYYSHTKPSDSGSYWHYVNGLATPWKE